MEKILLDQPHQTLQDEVQPPLTEPVTNPDIYYVYPEDDGTDRYRNPYGQH